MELKIADGTVQEGDRVQTFDIFLAKVVYGTIHENTEHKYVSDWYVKYDDGQDCAVLEPSTIFKA